MMSETMVVISDFVGGAGPAAPRSLGEALAAWQGALRSEGPKPRPTPDEIAALEVRGGYLERLPLAAVKVGLVARAEIWSHWRGDSPPFYDHEPALARRSFTLDHEAAPFASTDMLGFITAFGAPKILCVWGLGVDVRIIEACGSSFKIYNSIDAPAVRLPPETLKRFDLVLTGAEWQSEAVWRICPGMRCEIMPIGPEFADPLTFKPCGAGKLYDIIYVAAAQGYKRHDILFDALERRRGTSALCVCGYGELGETLRDEAGRRGLDVTFVGPPGVPFDEVNRLMNQARIGVVCGVDDGAPAILTEYMLAGLPVLANDRLACGLQFITPKTGLARPAHLFHEGIDDLLEAAKTMSPRAHVLENWTWEHSIARLSRLFEEVRNTAE